MIALLHGAPAFGAVERYVLAVGHGLAARGIDAALVFPDDPVLEPFYELEGSLTLVPMPVDAVRDAPAAAAFVRRSLRRLRPRVAHVTDVWPPALVAARAAGVRRVLLTHRTPELPRRDSLAGRAWFRLGWLTRPEVLYTSETDRRTDARRLLSTHVVPLGIDLEQFERPPQRLDTSTPTIGNVARLSAQKGHHTLIEAASRVLERYPGARFRFVGEGELRAELEAASQRAGLQDKIEFTGHRDDVADVLAGFDVFAFSSLFEGLCLAVIEAQAAGVPVVATAVGGIRETVIPGETGIIVPAKDPVALADAILELLDDPDHALRLAREAQRRVLEQFSEAAMVERTIRIYG